ncbi:ABC transporter permease [Mucilaginibacter xinganensis]|nr:ABC transporter permease subunit [Mucilaginibacter xinganensis]
MISLTYLPTPFASFKQIILLCSTKDFIIACGISLLRIVTAFAFASIVGVAIGSVAGVFLKFRAAILPLNSAFRYIPPTAFISLIIIWFGIGEMAKIILIFLAILFYIVQMVADVVKLTPTVYIQAAEMIGLSKFKIFKEVVLKYSYPDIISVLRVNLGAAWTFLIVSELVASQNGLGFLIATSQRFLMTANLFGLLIILGFLGFLSDTLFEVYIKKAGHWRK